MDESQQVFASRASLLALRNRRFGGLKLPVSGQWVRFRSLTDEELSAYDSALFARNQETGAVETIPERENDSRARLIVLTVCDNDGEPLFTDKDVELVAQFDPADILPLAEAIREHCGITAAIERRKQRESLKKN